jgi:tetratricopeptide (TPR) repeat protein
MHWKQQRSAARQYESEGDFDNAARCLEEAVATAQEADPCEVPLLLNVLSNLLMRAGDYAGAENAARRSIVEERRIGPPIEESDHLGSYHSALCQALRLRRRYNDALEALDESIRIFSLHVREHEPLMQNLRRLRDELLLETWRG